MKMAHGWMISNGLLMEIHDWIQTVHEVSVIIGLSQSSSNTPYLETPELQSARPSYSSNQQCQSLRRAT